MLMGVKEIQEVIPHRHPFPLVDCIEELEPGVRAVGYKCVTCDELFFKGHLSQEPATSGMLLVEAPAQTGTVVVPSQEGLKGEVAYFGDIDKAKLKRKVVPGDKVKLECEIIKQKGPIDIGKVTATVDGKLVASARLTFMVGQ